MRGKDASRSTPAGADRAPLTTVFFDLDDTLFDHARARRAGLRLIRSEIPRASGISVDDLDRRYQALVEAFHPQVLAGTLSRARARALRFRALAESLGSHLTLAAASSLGARYEEAYLAHRHAVPGARGLLDRLHGRVHLGVISNNLVAVQAGKLRDIGLAEFIDTLVISEEAGVAKPDPGIFQIALRRARAAPGGAVMVGDSWENDVVGARRAGIAGLWYHPDRRRSPSGQAPRLATFHPGTRAERAIRRAHRAHRTRSRVA